MLNGIEKIINTSLNLSVLFSEHWQNSILFTLDFHYGIGNLFKENIIKKHLFNLLYNKILYPIFLNGFLMKRQGKRSDLTSAQVAQKLTRKTSRQILAEQEGQSQDQIRRYIRLTSLVSELLEFVDLEKIKLCPAVELSYLDEEAQRDVVDQIDETAAFPSHAQTIRMRKAFEQGKLNYDLVKAIMNEEKPNQKPKYSFSYERLSTYIPKELQNDQVEEFVVEALKFYTSRRRGRKSTAAGKGCDVAS